MLDPALRATLEQRLGEIPFARTLEASPTATIKPAVSTSRFQSGSKLPLISLLLDAEAGPARNRAADDATPPDLEVRSVLGEGGMGKVQLAFQRSLGRDVAVKTTREGATASAASALVREAMITGTLEHPGVVPVHALGLDRDGAPVLVMKRIEGVEWGALIESPDHPAWTTRSGDRIIAHVEILMQICQTVHFAHKRGVLHLDIKPENVMVGSFGEVYLVDWGIARQFDPSSATPTPHPALAGTPAYMAPEMVSGSGVDARTDVFLLGATLHAALTGDVRNTGANVAEVLASAVAIVPFEYGPRLPEELAQICNRATARDPAMRFESVDALRIALAEHVLHRSSIRLAAQAVERSAALEALLASAPEGKPPADLRRAYELASQARFGFDQALREWPDNSPARERRAACLELMFDLELRQEHIDAAELVLDEIGPIPAAMRERLERARSEQAQKVAEHERLRALAHDRDSRVGSKQRALAVGLCSVATTAGAGVLLSYGERVPVQSLVWISISFLVAGLVITMIMRRTLLANAFNRQATALFILGTVGLTLNRGLALPMHTSVRTTLTHDMLILFLVAAAGAATLLRGLWLLAAVVLVSLFGAVALPDRATLFFAFDIAVLPLGILYAFRRQGA